MLYFAVFWLYLQSIIFVYNGKEKIKRRTCRDSLWFVFFSSCSSSDIWVRLLFLLIFHMLSSISRSLSFFEEANIHLKRNSSSYILLSIGYMVEGSGIMPFCIRTMIMPLLISQIDLDLNNIIRYKIACYVFTLRHRFCWVQPINVVFIHNSRHLAKRTAQLFYRVCINIMFLFMFTLSHSIISSMAWYSFRYLTKGS